MMCYLCICWYHTAPLFNCRCPCHQHYEPETRTGSGEPQEEK